LRDSRIYLGLGSNVGNRTAHLRAGLRGLQEHGLDVGAVSSFYLAEPDLGDNASAEATARHPWYVNCVAAVSGAASAADLLATCLSVERQRGRAECEPSEPTPLPSPRTLDVDILLIGSQVIDEPGLRVPHPRMSDRRFVLAPLAEIAAVARHPTAAATAAELLEALPDNEQVWLLAPSSVLLTPSPVVSP
jgi:2-amino-4-hydroxy-6-hydroxymethyldihydropteridine diphosphokinase